MRQNPSPRNTPFTFAEYSLSRTTQGEKVMTLSFRLINPARLGFLALTLQAASAAAQAPTPEVAAPAQPAPEAPPAEATVPAPVVAQQVAPPAEPVVTVPADTPSLDVATPPPPPPAEAPPAPDLGPLKIGVWSRVDLALSNGSSAAPGNFPSGDKLDDIFSTGEFELHASGKVHKYVSLTTNLVASYNAGAAGAGITGDASVMDGIVQIEPSEYLNIWVGRMLVPVDRSNFSGPYFMAPWYYPGFGFADGQVAVPAQGPYGRNDGVTVWGQVGGGLLKYYAGAFDLYDPGQSPLLSGRISLHLLNPEPGFYGSSTFHGMDLLSVGVGLQSKKNGSVAAPAAAGVAPLTDTYTEFNIDALFEKNLGSAGVLDVEGAFYKFDGDYQRTDAGWFGLASYILPGDVGGGKLQPLVRVQQAIPVADAAPTSTLVDAQVSYILNSYATLFTLGYRNGKAGDAKVQALYLGLQVQK
jgi:hypothetical protein